MNFNKISNKIVVAFFIAFICCINSPAQQIRFNNLSILHGLSQSTVNCVIQDKEGFMWIGTQDGLNKFDGYTFKQYRHDPRDKKAISDNYIQSLCEDKNGNIWIGTYGGGLSCLNKINNTFTTYKNDTSDVTSISNNVVMSIVADSKNNLWVGTQDGLNYFDVKEKKFVRYKSSDDKKSISSNKISSVFIDDRERLWIGTGDNGFNLMDVYNKIFTRFTSVEKDKNTLCNNAVKTIVQDHEGMLWIGTSGGGVDIFNPVNFSFTHFGDVVEEKKLGNNDIWTIFEDSDYNLWFGSYGEGLIKYNRKENQLSNFRNASNLPGSLSNDVILCAFEDYRGLFWVGTLGGGISIFDPVKESFDHYKKEQNDLASLSENMVMSFCEYGGDIWIGTYGGGLNKWDEQKKDFTHFRKNDRDKNSLSSDIVRCVYKDSRDRLWIGTYGGGLNLYNSGRFLSFRHDEDDASSISNDDVWCIKEDKDGSLWMGTWGGGLNHFNPETEKFTSYRNAPQKGSLSSNKVISVCIDRSDNLWVGTNGGGLNLYDRKNNEFIVFRNIDSDESSLSSNRIRSIVQDQEKDVLWIGTDGGGLCRMDLATRKFSSVAEKDGLPNNVVYGILQDDNGNLWLSTNNGICKYNPNKNTFQNFDVRDGLQSNEFNQGAYLKARNGKMYFGGVNGFNSFSPQAIRKNPNRPPVYITSVKLFNNEVPSDSSFTFRKTLDLQYRDNFLSFEFAALDFTAPEKNQYACMMEGFDKDWIKLGNRRFVSYTNLDPGKYIFRLKASNNDGVWNDTGNFIIINIEPPFWKTLWFYFLIIALGIISIYLYITFRTKRLKRDKVILEKEVATRTQEVVHQKDIIERKNKDITDSINYAKRIQEAILPSKETIKRLFPSSFIFYKPKDIVSGDFYWMEQSGNRNFVAAVDCTGHGVPGAFMSIVGYNLLNQAVNEHGIDQPAVILNEINRGLSKQLRQQDETISVRDGMDIALCAFDKKDKKLLYAGANNPLWIVRNGELIQVKADKQPIGIYNADEMKQFTVHETDLISGDMIYIFSDGFADQFGGPAGKKFKYKGFQQLLLSIAAMPVNTQRDLLERTIDDWRGELEQVDDILVIGIKVE